MRQLATRIFLLLCTACIAASSKAQPDNILLKNYRPESIYKVPQMQIAKAAFPVTDLHSHDFATSQEEIDRWVKIMDSLNIKTTVILTYNTGKGFDSVVQKYSRYPKRFVFYCGFDYTGFGQPGWKERAVAELERCYKNGARGVGELGDKGEGELYSMPTPGVGVHIDNPDMKPLLQKCGELKIPISIHVAEDQWMYEKPDSTNDGLMNAAQWHVDMNKPGKLGHDELIRSLENAVRDNPKTTFIACHLANTCSNLDVLGKLLDKYPNLNADIAARYSEIAPIPKFAAAFITKYQDRIVYGTDMAVSPGMYAMTFRILESPDEHFYYFDHFTYHWPLYGLNLSKEVLRKVYGGNAERIMNKR